VARSAAEAERTELLETSRMERTKLRPGQPWCDRQTVLAMVRRRWPGVARQWTGGGGTEEISDLSDGRSGNEWVHLRYGLANLRVPKVGHHKLSLIY
jgi:hypothetical protein